MPLKIPQYSVPKSLIPLTVGILSGAGLSSRENRLKMPRLVSPEEQEACVQNLNHAHELTSLQLVPSEQDLFLLTEVIDANVGLEAT
jgi:hypothetical protein